MDGEFKVDLPGLTDLLARMDAVNKDTADNCEQLAAKVSNLQALWEGQAAVAQNLAHQQWQEGAEQMRSALTSLRGLGTTAHGNYSEAIKTNSKMWQ